MAPIIRKGKREDARFLAKVMLMASRGHLKLGVWDLIIGGDEKACLDYLTRLALAEPVSLCHYLSFWVAQCEGQPAVALCGFDPNQGGWPQVTENLDGSGRRWDGPPLTSASLRYAPRRYGHASPARRMERGSLRTSRRCRSFAGGVWWMRCSGSPGSRPQPRSSPVAIDGANRQPSAQKAYEKVGFKFFDEKRSADFEALIGSPGFRRLMMDL